MSVIIHDITINFYITLDFFYKFVKRIY